MSYTKAELESQKRALKAKVKELEAQNAQLEAQNAQLEARIKELEAQIPDSDEAEQPAVGEPANKDYLFDNSLSIEEKTKLFLSSISTPAEAEPEEFEDEPEAESEEPEAEPEESEIEPESDDSCTVGGGFATPSEYGVDDGYQDDDEEEEPEAEPESDDSEEEEPEDDPEPVKAKIRHPKLTIFQSATTDGSRISSYWSAEGGSSYTSEEQLDPDEIGPIESGGSRISRLFHR